MRRRLRGVEILVKTVLCSCGYQKIDSSRIETPDDIPESCGQTWTGRGGPGVRADFNVGDMGLKRSEIERTIG